MAVALFCICFGIMVGMTIVLFLAVRRIVETESFMRSLVGELFSAKGVRIVSSKFPSGGISQSIEIDEFEDDGFGMPVPKSVSALAK